MTETDKLSARNRKSAKYGHMFECSNSRFSGEGERVRRGKQTETLKRRQDKTTGRERKRQGIKTWKRIVERSGGI